MPQITALRGEGDEQQHQEVLGGSWDGDGMLCPDFGGREPGGLSLGLGWSRR